MLFPFMTLFYLTSFSLSSIPTSTAISSPGVSNPRPGANADAAIIQTRDDSSYTDRTTFQRAMVSTHNKWRREHGVNDVSWDTKLAEFAAGHTQKCEWGHSGGPYGENLAAGYKTAQLALDAWGEERRLYRSLGAYDQAVPPQNTGHFTQMVWAATDKIGCARTKCADIIADGVESWYVVCEYTARGNVRGAYTRNVFKPVRRPQ